MSKVLAENERRRDEKLAAWRKTHRRTQMLSTGLEVTIKRVGVLDLAGEGAIPETLEEIADRYINGQREVSIADLPKFMGLLNAVVRVAVVDPPIADVEDETHLTVEEIPAEDRMKIFDWANGNDRAFDAPAEITVTEKDLAQGKGDRHA